jgi:hypothetical protein
MTKGTSTDTSCKNKQQQQQQQENNNNNKEDSSSISRSERNLRKKA